MKEILDWNDVPTWVRVKEACPWVNLENLNLMSQGNESAVEPLITALNNEDRDELVRWVFDMPHSIKVRCKTLSSAWVFDYRMVMQSAGTMTKLLRWFRTANFPTDHLPDNFPV